MNNFYAFGVSVAASVALAACGGAATTNTAKAPSNSATSTAGNSAAPASSPSNSAAPAGGSEDQTNQNFTLNNRSQAVISHVYVSAADDSNWGEDIMGQDVLNAGQSVEIEFPREASQCNWDVRVTIDGDQNEEIRNVNLCETTEVNYGG